MGILGWQLRRGMKVEASAKAPSYMSDSYDQLGMYGGEEVDPSVYSRQAERYSRSDLVYMCVSRLASMSAMYARHLHLFDPAGTKDPVSLLPEEEVEGHPFTGVWDRPNAWYSAYDLLECMVISLQLTGNTFIHLDDGKKPGRVGPDNARRVELEGDPIAFWPLRTDRVRIIPDAKEYIKGYMYELNGQKFLFSPESVLHVKKYNPLRDHEGMSPIEAANYASLTDMEAQKANYALFKNSMRLSGIVESERETVDADEVKLMKEYLLKTYTGDGEKAHQVAFLWSQFKYKELGMSMRDAEFVEGQKMSRMRIFGVFGVHPGIVLSEDVNRANAEVGEYMTLKFTVVPMLTQFANAITRVLPYWKSAPPAEAQFVGVVPADNASEATTALTRAQAAQILIITLGPEQGVREAVRQGLVDDSIDPATVPQPGGGNPFGGLMSKTNYP